MSEIYQNIGNAFVGTATPYYVESGHFYLESNNVKDGQINRNNEVFINNEFYERQKDKWLHTGDMVMVQSGHVGHAAVIPEELDNSAAHALIMFRNPKLKIEPYFLNYQYQTTKTKKKIENITTGNTIKHILASDMQEFIVEVPNIAEQEQIGAYFKNLDHLITLHQRKYIHYLLYHFSTKNAIIFDEFFLLPIPFYHISRSEFAQLQKIPGKFRGFLIIQIFLHTSPTCGNRQYSSFFRECGESS